MFTIYLITNTVNGKYYVGQTARKAHDRFLGHFMQARQGSPLRLHCAIRKHGTENFIQEVLTTAETRDQAAMYERLWITALDSMKFVNGYNASPGGDVRSKESIRSAAEKIRGNQWNVGYEHTEKACRNMSASQQGHTVSQATRDKIAATRKAKIAAGEIKMPEGRLTYWLGKKQSTEANKARSVTLTGKYVGALNSMFGKKWTPEHRANVMKASALRETHNG